MATIRGYVKSPDNQIIKGALVRVYLDDTAYKGETVLLNNVLADSYSGTTGLFELKLHPTEDTLNKPCYILEIFYKGKLRDTFRFKIPNDYDTYTLEDLISYTQGGPIKGTNSSGGDTAGGGGSTPNTGTPPSTGGGTSSGPVSAGTATSVNKLGAASRKVSILIPLYAYPSNAYTNELFNRLINICHTYPKVEFNIILNNANGVGSAKDGNYTAVAKRLKAAGNVRILGYVSTGYASVETSSVKGVVDTWIEWYQPDGIFYDELNPSTAEENLEYYKDLKEYAHARGLWPVVANPGAPVLEPHFSNNVADIICIYELPQWPEESLLKGDYQGGFYDYPPQMRASLVYGQPTFDPKLADLLAKYTSSIYITDDNFPNPWDDIPTYLEEFAKYMSDNYS